ncbi:hypothetical protein B0H67DRAFT_52002 [Lasiosphaeris hirsuta]|uniref:Uncharacterized protein n=1 Tax=Lasiosphaeris hirsuta TaxID=260670 RepID=A0AA40BAR9_9PEZI|nr:hypothetical protein B0H67DRAFT_52002 [Lasiosphaeris hirsuta]
MPRSQSKWCRINGQRGPELLNLESRSQPQGPSPRMGARMWPFHSAQRRTAWRIERRRGEPAHTTSPDHLPYTVMPRCDNARDEECGLLTAL